ncbi:hypothetical protein LENED_000955 [Lentinula edodes]|uniref:Uncharacterized protein n=1 Tax=Lentinula edodes TaxID=5353 RepID=A0A1Q3DX45_LENED|nr:hypothetical protein LENED_000955 [Lentinula edodes]
MADADAPAVEYFNSATITNKVASVRFDLSNNLSLWEFQLRDFPALLLTSPRPTLRCTILFRGEKGSHLLRVHNVILTTGNPEGFETPWKLLGALILLHMHLHALITELLPTYSISQPLIEFDKVSNSSG